MRASIRAAAIASLIMGLFGSLPFGVVFHSVPAGLLFGVFFGAAVFLVFLVTLRKLNVRQRKSEEKIDEEILLSAYANVRKGRHLDGTPSFSEPQPVNIVFTPDRIIFTSLEGKVPWRDSLSYEEIKAYSAEVKNASGTIISRSNDDYVIDSGQIRDMWALLGKKIEETRTETQGE